MRLKFKLLKNRILYIVYNIVLLTLAFLLDRFYQMLTFILFFEIIQSCFLKRFHSDTLIDNPVKAVKYCKIITIVVEITYLIYCKELNISIYSNLLIIFLIAFTNSLLQFYAERVVINSSNLADLDYLTNICNEAGLSELSTNRMIMRYVEKKTYKEIAQIEFVDEESIRKSIKRSKKKLKI